MEKFEQVLPDVWLLKVPFGIVWTGVILVRGEKTFLIDSSQAQPEEFLIPALDALGVCRQGLTVVTPCSRVARNGYSIVPKEVRSS